MKVIEVKHLSKSFKVKLKEKGFKGTLMSLVKPKFKTIKAVKNISFDVEKGEVIAFIGPNGAGKSTTIKMMTSILHPDKGEIKVMGLDPVTDRKKLSYEIGTVFGQKEQLWTHLTPYDNFKFLVLFMIYLSFKLRRRLLNLDNYLNLMILYILLLEIYL